MRIATENRGAMIDMAMAIGCIAQLSVEELTSGEWTP